MQLSLRILSKSLLPLAALLLLTLPLLAGCQDQGPESSVADSPRWVKTAPLTASSAPTLSLTGVLRARYETPMAFRVSGQIATRHVDAGQRVKQGEVLFTLDPSDLEESLAAARAELAAAEAALDVAEADLSRDRQLLNKGYLSRQAFERAELGVRETATRREAASARVTQARNALDHASLRAEDDGVLIDVSGEPGQVVGVGQAVARLAQEGPREVEVNFPARSRPPQTGELLVGEKRITLIRREVAGAADPASRTWRARYRLEAPLEGRSLGDVVQTRFILAEAASQTRFQVPVAALDERGEGPRLWQIVEGEAQPLPVTLEQVTRDHAWVSGDGLEAGEVVISLGTHLLTAGMAVRPLDEKEAP
ncbi:efflux RND transporter periplasmic adaptor subunit [Halomonas marinisediminis]|uniref:Efflux RND transporter periplasmic adaptor subunit n=1 Tax=Halomonas marinisediminis TaxID=2546095 RepID=A0ABY2DA69_9GAMM|nr:efflux RND transporter periplasmic adaptor subunit [Halomonas marinisediminis]TDB02965.1 efflux RND transporter periplasmic adaptor subunit [Halomonas marinisediminis]